MHTCDWLSFLVAKERSALYYLTLNLQVLCDLLALLFSQHDVHIWRQKVCLPSGPWCCSSTLQPHSIIYSSHVLTRFYGVLDDSYKNMQNTVLWVLNLNEIILIHGSALSLSWLLIFQQWHIYKTMPWCTKFIFRKLRLANLGERYWQKCQGSWVNATGIYNILSTTNCVVGVNIHKQKTYSIWSL